MVRAKNSYPEDLDSIPYQANYVSWKSWILTYNMEESSDLSYCQKHKNKLKSIITAKLGAKIIGPYNIHHEGAYAKRNGTCYFSHNLYAQLTIVLLDSMSSASLLTWIKTCQLSKLHGSRFRLIKKKVARILAKNKFREEGKISFF